MEIHGFQDTIDWYNANAETYAESGIHNFDLNHIHTFVASLIPGANVIDLGCGPGRDTNLLAKEGLKVTGLDISDGLLRVARRDFPHLTFVEGNLFALPFSEESFDGAWSNASLLHLETIENVSTALREVYRVLKKGGIFHILVKAQTGTEKTAIVADTLSQHDRFFHYFTTDELSQLLQEAGFAIIHTKQYNETETIRGGRPEVELIWVLAQKT